jgi:hypothetical protein
LSEFYNRFGSHREIEATFGRITNMEGVPAVPQGAESAHTHGETVNCIMRWLSTFTRARYTINLGYKDHVEKHDYFALVADERKARRLPEARIGNLQSDATLLLRVVDVYADTSVATIEEWAYKKQFDRQHESSQREAFTCAEAPQFVALVKAAQMVVQVPRREKELYDSLQGSPLDLINRADDYLLKYPNGFFAGAVLFKKAQAHEALGEEASARATFERLVHEYPFHPSSDAAEDWLLRHTR